MSERKIPFTDRRGVSARNAATEPLPEGADVRAAPPEATAPDAGTREQAGRDYLADLQRVQAEFDNFRKRAMREQTSLAGRATARLVERLLPILDNFERAIEHGEGGEGVALVFKELRGALEAEGLEEIAAEGALFDPRVHEAVQSHEADVAEPVVESLFRRGYRLGDQVLRPAMVVVARPHESEPSPSMEEGD